MKTTLIILLAVLSQLMSASLAVAESGDSRINAACSESTSYSDYRISKIGEVDIGRIFSAPIELSNGSLVFTGSNAIKILDKTGSLKIVCPFPLGQYITKCEDHNAGNSAFSINSLVKLPGDRFAAATQEGNLLIFNSDGSTHATFHSGETFDVSENPAVLANGTIAITNRINDSLLFVSTNGELKSKHSFPKKDGYGWEKKYAVLEDGSLLIQCEDQKLCVFDSNGNRKSNFPVNKDYVLHADPVITKDGIFLPAAEAGSNGRLFLFDKKGREIWSKSNKGSDASETYGSPWRTGPSKQISVTSDGNFAHLSSWYLRSNEIRIHFFDKQGKKLAEHPLSTDSLAPYSPVPISKNMLVRTDDRQMTFVFSSTGEKLATFQDAGRPGPYGRRFHRGDLHDKYAPFERSDGTLMVPSSDGRLVLLKVEEKDVPEETTSIHCEETMKVKETLEQVLTPKEDVKLETTDENVMIKEIKTDAQAATSQNNATDIQVLAK